MELCGEAARRVDGSGRASIGRSRRLCVLQDEPEQHESEVAVDRLGAGRVLERRLTDRGLELAPAAVLFVEVQVGGQTAAFVDQQASLSSRIPLALAVLALGTFVFLFMMTGSVVIPLKALLMNLLTLSATFGILVLVFQDGRLEGLFGYTSRGAVDPTQPIPGPDVDAHTERPDRHPLRGRAGRAARGRLRPHGTGAGHRRHHLLHQADGA